MSPVENPIANPNCATQAPSNIQYCYFHNKKHISRAPYRNLTGQGSGVYGSIKSGDVPAAAAPAAVSPAAPAPAPGASYVDIPLSGMRETIAKRLSAAKQTIPHYQLSVTVNVEKLLSMRKEVNERLAKEKSDVKVSSISSCCFFFILT